MTAEASPAPLPEVLLIDLSSLYWTSWHVTVNDARSDATALTMTAIRRCVGELDGKLVAICCDQGRSLRKTLSPDYKANRPEKDQSAIAELEKLKDKLRDEGYWLAGADGFEADDVIATLATAASKAGHPIRIASADKDLLQLLALPDSSALRTFNDWATVRAADVIEKFGVDPEGLRDYLALVGDKSDNVLGCPSVGPVTAKALLLGCYDIDGLYAKIEALNGATMTPEAKKIATPAVLAKLVAHKADVMLARQLVTLRTDAPVPLAPLYERREPKKRERKPMDEEPEDRISGPPPKVKCDGDHPSPACGDKECWQLPDPKGSAVSSGEASTPAASAPIQSVAGITTGTTNLPTNSGTTPASTETRALTVVDVTYERALEPRTPSQAVQLGEILYASRAFVRFPTAESLTACVLGGRELGLGAIASTNAFHFMAEMGCLALKAHTIGELGMRHPSCKYLRLTHSDEFYAEYEGWHVDHPAPYTHRYTIQDAVDAGLATLAMVPRTAGPKEKDARGQWDKRRKEMLRARCLTQVVRILWPGAAHGFYSLDEMGGDE